MDLISIVIPSYNHEQYIKYAVNSALEQRNVNLELIVVDDGSTDDSLKFLRGIRDSRFQLVEQQNAGAHNAINKGLSQSRGDYLAILNSDDIFHEDRLAICLDRLKEGAELVSSWIEVIDRKGKVLGVKEGWKNMLPWSAKMPAKHLVAKNSFAVHLLQSNFVSTTSNMVFSRRVYEAIGGMRNLRFAHDWDFLLRVARQFRCELIEIPLLRYRIHPTNTISSNRQWMLFEICWIYAVHFASVFRSFETHAGDTNSQLAEIDFMAQSVNLQGNDKVLWMLLQFFEKSKISGEIDPAGRLLDDAKLRRAFIEHVV